MKRLINAYKLFREQIAKAIANLLAIGVVLIPTVIGVQSLMIADYTKFTWCLATFVLIGYVYFLCLDEVDFNKTLLSDKELEEVLNELREEYNFDIDDIMQVFIDCDYDELQSAFESKKKMKELLKQKLESK